jgi:anti-anti-sigma regulatory factor
MAALSKKPRSTDPEPPFKGPAPAPDASGAGRVPPGGDAPAAAPPPPANYLEIARIEQTVIIRVNGLGNMKVAMGLMDFTTEMLRSGYTQFIFDLGPCKGLDSTFMGAMVGLAAAAQEDGGGAAVVNSGTDTTELLQIVGADKFLKLAGEYKMEAIETERLEAPPPSADRRLELVKKAHENLVVIDKRNEARFGAFLRQLSNELAK